MINFINKWSKRFAVIWLIGFIGILAITYADSIQNSKAKYSWWSPKFADINLFLPYSVQKSLSSNNRAACIAKTNFPFERTVIGYRKHTLEGTFLNCEPGKSHRATEYLFILLVPFIGLNYVLPWLTRVLEGAGKNYKSSAKKAKVNTEKNYLIAYKEVESGKIKSPELWAKAFAETEGDEVKQKALYVELRTKQLDDN
ncbi:hypothetical protein ACMAZA_04855 [Pseudothioglobus sp. nBUS_23]|uniref:hypothetical protein n=1 Tax=Pseudothioglobus sp. nBUS_23 TaxID=3395318 RepID=UPI003EBA457A